LHQVTTNVLNSLILCMFWRDSLSKKSHVFTMEAS